MDKIIIDSANGLVGICGVVKAARPVMNDKNILRSVRRALINYSGTNMSKTRVDGNMLHVCPLETCLHVLDNITGIGRGWIEWRNASGQAFKASLRERLQSVCSVSQADCEVQTKACLLRQRFAHVGIYGFRVDEAMGIASVIDVIKLICPGTSRCYAKTALNKLISTIRMETQESSDTSHQTSIADRIHRIKINGKGHITPCSDAKTIVEIMLLLPGKVIAEFKRTSALTIRRVMGGDVSICSEIEQRCARLQSTEAGRTAQQFLLQDQPSVVVESVKF